MEIIRGQIDNVNVKVMVRSYEMRDTVETVNLQVCFSIVPVSTPKGTVDNSGNIRYSLDIHRNLIEEYAQNYQPGKTMLDFIRSLPDTQFWLDNIVPVMTYVDSGVVTNTASEPTPAKAFLAPASQDGLNTLTLKELEEACKQVVWDNDGQTSRGIIRSGHITLEDSLPWVEVEFKGKGSVKKAKEFCQQLADKMNIRILFNRVESYGNEYEVYAVMDIEYENMTAQSIPQALSNDPEWAEYMEDYGTAILPSHTKKAKKKTI